MRPAEPVFLKARGARLEAARIDGRRPGPTLVFLHDALGCVALWRDFPALVAGQTGLPAFLWSRLGHGRSDPYTADKGMAFMEEEALVWLPAVLDAAGIEDAILVGHSDGGSIALVAAGNGMRRARAVVSIAHHVLIEDVTHRGIAAAAQLFATTDLPAKLARYHFANTETVFRNWSEYWRAPAYRSWNIEGCLAGIACPLLLVQGARDEHGSLEQVERARAQAGGPVDALVMEGVAHFPHRERPEAVAARIAAFVRAVLAD